MNEMPQIAPWLGEGRALTFAHRTFWTSMESSGQLLQGEGQQERTDIGTAQMDAPWRSLI